MQHSTNDIEMDQISDDDSFGSDFDSAAEEMDLLLSPNGQDGDQVHLLPSTHPGSSEPTPKPDIPRRPNSLTLSERSPRSSISSAPSAGMCAVCQVVPVYSDGPNVYPTCGNTCASILQSGTGLPDPNGPRTSGPPHTTPVPSSPTNPDRTSFLSSWPSEPTTYASHARFQPRPNQIKMCDVCHVRPRYQRGGRIYPTCGLSCAAKMHASIEMCDYCKKRPKAIVNGKMFPQCGRTCRDKAKLAETAANAAVCTSCILCWKSTKAKQSDFCSQACKLLADGRAPFLIEIPRGHVAFKQVADAFATGWRKSNTHRPAVKRVYMVVMKPSFITSHERYRTKIGTNGILQRKANERTGWLLFSRECGFGDSGNLEPCSSKQCLLCCIVRSSFSRFDFPAGITTTTLNRAVELYRNGKKSSSKIAALTHVLVGREAEMTPQEVQVVRPIPPQGSDSVHIIGVRNDGSKVDMGDIVVYDGDAVRPLYIISYE